MILFAQKVIIICVQWLSREVNTLKGLGSIPSPDRFFWFVRGDSPETAECNVRNTFPPVRIRTRDPAVTVHLYSRMLYQLSYRRDGMSLTSRWISTATCLKSKMLVPWCASYAVLTRHPNVVQWHSRQVKNQWCWQVPGSNPGSGGNNV